MPLCPHFQHLWLPHAFSWVLGGHNFYHSFSHFAAHLESKLPLCLLPLKWEAYTMLVLSSKFWFLSKICFYRVSGFVEYLFYKSGIYISEFISLICVCGWVEPLEAYSTKPEMKLLVINLKGPQSLSSFVRSMSIQYIKSLFKTLGRQQRKCQEPIDVNGHCPRSFFLSSNKSNFD